MEHHRKTLQLCAALLLGAVILRLIGNIAHRANVQDMASALLFLQTGRVVRLADEPPQPTEATQAAETEPAPAAFVFTAQDARLVSCTGQDTDIAACLAEPLTWQLRSDVPTVLILHSHATESYLNTEGYTETSQYRTLEEAHNMISIGAYLQQLLQQQGIRTLHARQLHDHPSYNGSYEQSRITAREHLQQTPSIRLILDLHRDALADEQGNQIGYTVDTPEAEAAKLMLVVGLWHENWQENLALAVKLHARLEQLCPGICRPISLRDSRFNQDLSPGALLIEVGAAGNTRQQALCSVQILAQAIISLSDGSVMEGVPG